jgi:LacI family transcriptional regulator
LKIHQKSIKKKQEDLEMAHDFLIKDIAFQAGLSTATVDRVINNRGGVRYQTQERIQAAIAELQQQHVQALPAQKFTLDVVMEAPDRFTDTVRMAFESEAAAFLPTIFRARFHFWEQSRSRDLVQLLMRIRQRKSHGVVLKAPARSDINMAVDGLIAADIPVVTLVTDLPDTGRTAYVGIDNRAAGETAAHVMGQALRDVSGTILVTLSSSSFHGEAERKAGFSARLRQDHPRLKIVEISEGYGKNSETEALVRKALLDHPDSLAVYSAGGANRAILSAFEASGKTCSCFIAHDLDQDNLALLRSKSIQFVLHHDLKMDVRSIFQTVLQRQSPKRIAANRLAAIQVVTPYNIPPDFL